MEATQETLGTGWIEFSERHARAASSDFARSVVQYFNSTLPAEARGNVSHKDLLKTFVATFSDNFEYEYLRRSVQQGSSKVRRLGDHFEGRDTGKKYSRIPRTESKEEENKQGVESPKEKRTKRLGAIFRFRGIHFSLTPPDSTIRRSHSWAASNYLQFRYQVNADDEVTLLVASFTTFHW